MFKVILAYILTILIVLISFNLLKIFVLNKFNINKWIVLTISLIILIVPPIFYNMTGTAWQFVHAGIFMLVFLWFMDLMGWGGGAPQEKKKKTVIRPKAKPNRVKNKNNK